MKFERERQLVEQEALQDCFPLSMSPAMFSRRPVTLERGASWAEEASPRGDRDRAAPADALREDRGGGGAAEDRDGGRAADPPRSCELYVVRGEVWWLAQFCL